MHNLRKLQDTSNKKAWVNGARGAAPIPGDFPPPGLPYTL
jgi:hypothetical protein